MNSDKTTEPETIIAIHGIGSNRFLMHTMCQRLRSLGYRVENWSYFSFAGSISGHADRLRKRLSELQSNSKRVHIVAHSLGAIVARAALAQSTKEDAWKRIGRIVLLTPPNRGSPYGRIFGPFVGWFCKSVSDVSDSPTSFVNRLPTLSEFEVGVLASTSDFLIPESSTHLEGERDYALVKCRHSTILFSPVAIELIDRFLREGSFGSSTI